MKVGAHQGSVISPLLFIIVLEALSREFWAGVPWENLYGHFHFKLEKKFSQGVQKKYPYIILIYVFSFCIYPKLHGKYF